MRDMRHQLLAFFRLALPRYLQVAQQPLQQHPNITTYQVPGTTHEHTSLVGERCVYVYDSST